MPIFKSPELLLSLLPSICLSVDLLTATLLIYQGLVLAVINVHRDLAKLGRMLSTRRATQPG